MEKTAKDLMNDAAMLKRDGIAKLRKNIPKMAEIAGKLVAWVSELAACRTSLAQIAKARAMGEGTDELRCAKLRQSEITLTENLRHADTWLKEKRKEHAEEVQALLVKVRDAYAHAHDRLLWEHSQQLREMRQASNGHHVTDALAEIGGAEWEAIEAARRTNHIEIIEGPPPPKPPLVHSMDQTPAAARHF